MATSCSEPRVPSLFQFFVGSLTPQRYRGVTETKPSAVEVSLASRLETAASKKDEDDETIWIGNKTRQATLFRAYRGRLLVVSRSHTAAPRQVALLS